MAAWRMAPPRWASRERFEALLGWGNLGQIWSGKRSFAPRLVQAALLHLLTP